MSATYLVFSSRLSLPSTLLLTTNSHLVYVLKKFNKSTFLIRAYKSDVIAILQKMLNQLGAMNELSKFSVKGVEQLISRQEHYST